MIAVSLATFLITPWRYFADPTCTERSRGFAVFLSFIALFALTALQQGLIVLRHKRRDARLITAATVALPAALTLAALALAAWGFARGTWLYVIFAALGAKTGVEQLAFWARKPVGPRPWLRCHLENFFVACIATVTAFLVTAAPRLFPGAEFDSIWVWLAPTFVLVPWQVYFKRRLAL